MLNQRFIASLNAILLFLSSLLVGFLFITNTQVQKELTHAQQRVLGATVPTFDRNLIISDEEFRSTAVFGSVASVQNYLTAKNSPLANYSENGKTAAEIIFGSARGEISSQYGIVPQLNPGMLMAKIQKESSLLWATGYDTVNDPEYKLKYTMGYACPDPAPGQPVQCDPKYVGFTNQVRMAAYQLEYNFQLATKSESSDQYKVGNTIRTLDGYNVYLTNAATAALYRYTPHVYWGNYNQFKLMAISGWLSNGVAYTAEQIDALNLPNKNPDSTVESGTVLYSEIADLLIQPPVLGSANERISKLQTFLKMQGFFSYPSITGYFGTITQAALDAYKTSDKYTAALSCDALKSVQWAQGMSGPAVTKLQECMQIAGHFKYEGGPTGYFGPVTQTALDAWRKSSVPVTPPPPVVTPPPAVPTAPVQVPQPAPQPQPNPPTPTPSQPSRCDQLKSRTWKIGESGQDVRDLQQCLKDEGVYKWQYGITGYFGSYTQGLLQKPTSNNSACSDLKSRTWTIGQTGSDVSALQQCLKDEGKYNWPAGITGYFGPYTQSLLGTPVNNASCNAQVTQAKQWSIGRAGQDVRDLQQCLQNAGIYRWPYGVTGYYGSYTQGILP